MSSGVRRVLLSAVVVLSLWNSGDCGDGVFVPAPFAEIDGELIQEFSASEALEHCGGSMLMNTPVDACVIDVNDSLEISLYLDNVWNKIVYAYSVLDEDGLRRRTRFGSYAGPYGDEFSNPSGIAFDPEWFFAPISVPGGGSIYCRVWPVFVADTGNDRVVELNLFVPVSLDSMPGFSRRLDIGAEDLSKPMDVSFCDSWGYLYVIHGGMRPLVAYDTRREHGTYPVRALEFGFRGDGICEFQDPVSIHCDADAGTWPQYVYVCDPLNNRVVCLRRGDPYEASVGWHGYYQEPFFRPVSVSGFQGCGVYVLDRGPGGPEIDVFTSELTHKLAVYSGDEMLLSRSVHVRAGEAGIVNLYSKSSGIGYYLLDAKVENAAVSPNPFDPLETHTLVSYTLSGYGNLAVRVYDSAWALRRTLVDSVMCSAGGHWEWWDGRDDSGSLLSSGVYHIEMVLWDHGGDGIPDKDTVDVEIASVPLQVLTTGFWVKDPSWSNAGDRIAFASAAWADTANGIWVTAVGGGSPTRVTQPGLNLYDLHSDWSPTDSFLVFQRSATYTFAAEEASGAGYGETGPSLLSPDLGESWIYRIRQDGTGETLLTSGGEKWDWHPIWSPYLTNESGVVPLDGGRIAFWCYADHQLWTFKAMDGSDRMMIAGGADSISTDPLPDKGLPAWSPDGGHIAFQTRPTGSIGVWRIEVETGSYSLLCRESDWGDVSGVSWAPGGGAVAYEIADSDTLRTGIKAVSAEGMYELGYIVRNEYGYGFDWSPDGTKLAFVVWSGGYPSLAITDFRRDASAFPAANIISPVSGQVLTGTVEIRGVANDNVSVDGFTPLSELTCYNLEWGLGSEPLVWSSDGVSIAGGKIDGGVLGTWDTSSLDEGDYSVRLTASDSVDLNTDVVRVRICHTSSVEDRDRNPISFGVHEIRPNPFVNCAAIRLGIPVAGNTQVQIFDCRGRSVRVLHDGVADVGVTDLTWDGKDKFGAQCSPGVYWCRVSSGGRRDAGKVVLLR